jgi:hypothetical protein
MITLGHVALWKPFINLPIEPKSVRPVVNMLRDFTTAPHQHILIHACVYTNAPHHDYFNFSDSHNSSPTGM